MTDIIQEMQTAEAIVRRVLETHPDAKDSDKELFIGVMQEAGANLSFFQQDIIRELFALETYTRARRIIQNEKRTMQPSVSVQKQRKQREVEHRQAAITHWEVIPGTNTMTEVPGPDPAQQGRFL
ncbi:MAG: hypothetical protein KGI08_01980 [Thaumarchaeota archaeon]|nr:hypothetical protein [Nitrososphaerota archaeon]